MAKKRRVMSKAAKLAHYKSLKAQMEVNGVVTPIERARYAKYVNAIKKLGGSVHANDEMMTNFYRAQAERAAAALAAVKNPRGFGGTMLTRDRHGRFVKSNPHGAHGYGHAFGKYAKKGKRKMGEFFGGMAQGWRENPAMSFPQMGVVSNPYGGGLFGPKSNPKRKSSSKAARGRALAHSLARDSKGRFVKRNPRRRHHY